MPYLGRHEIDDLLTFPANTHTTAGAATDADAVPAYRVYKDETATPILTGTMALLDGSNTVGLYSEQITLSAANGFEVGKSYTIYISAAVSSVTGTMAHTFQVELAPATAAALATVQADTDDIQTRIPAALTSGRINANVGAIEANVVNDAAVAADVTIASVTGAVGSVTGAVGSVTGNVGGNVVGSVASVTAGVTVTTNNDKAGYGLSAAAVQAIWDALASALTTVGSIGKLLVDNLNATISSRLATAGYTAPPTVADILAGVIEGSITLKGALRLALSALTGKASGGGTTTVIFRDTGDTKARITATVDSSGNRTAITRDITD